MSRPTPTGLSRMKETGQGWVPKELAMPLPTPKSCPTVEDSSLCENRNCLFIHKEISKLTNPPMPSSTGYWDGTTWKTHKPKKGATAWTGVSNLNLNKTHQTENSKQRKNLD